MGDGVDGEDLLQKLKDIFEEAIKPRTAEELYPEEALPKGTYVRSIRLNKLGIVTDAFYGDVDTEGTKIIIYTILLFPSRDFGGAMDSHKDQYYVSNEYEYEIIGYLMMAPANMTAVGRHLRGGLF